MKDRSLEDRNQEKINTGFIYIEGEYPIGEFIQESGPTFLEAEYLAPPDEYYCISCGWHGKTEPALKRHITMVHKCPI